MTERRKVKESQGGKEGKSRREGGKDGRNARKEKKVKE